MARIIERLVRFVVSSLIRSFIWGLMAIRMILPWVFRFLWFMLRLIAISILSLIVGVPKAVDRIASSWLGVAVARGFPTEYDTFLYYTLAVFAFLMILAGWLFASGVTVGGLYLVFAR